MAGSLCGAIWFATFGSFETTMTLAGFLLMPRIGSFDRKTMRGGETT
jgi:hypothetical protein